MVLLSDLEFQGGLYYDKEIGPFVPAEAIDAMLKKSAARFRNSRAFVAAVATMPDRIPLEYKGPRTIEELLKQPEFRDVRSVVVNRSRVMRTRPRFNRWRCEFDIQFIEGVVTEEQVVEAMEYAGQMIGLCDYRPRYGRFNVMNHAGAGKDAA